MNDAQAALDGGLLTYLVEHVGDLTNRMMKVGYYDIEAGGYEKVASALHTLRHPGFYREWWENVHNNARSKGTPLAEYWARAKSALQRYADEHRKLPVYNQAQFAAREAAVALGEQRFADAVTMLEYLEALVTDGTWEAAVREYRLAPDGSVMEFPWTAGGQDAEEALSENGHAHHWTPEKQAHKWLVTRLLSPAGRDIVDRLYGPDSFVEGDIWSRGGCLLLAVALGHVLDKDVVLMLEEDDAWVHAAVLLSPDTTMDWEQEGESPALLMGAWPTAVETSIWTLMRADWLLDGDEARALPELIALLMPLREAL